MEKMKPLHDWVIIRRDPPEKQTAGGIIINENFEDHTGTGTVEYVGPGTKSSPMLVKPGDRVQWDKYYKSGFDVEEGYVAVHCSDLQAVIGLQSYPFQCPYMAGSCRYIDTGDMSKTKECRDCEHYINDDLGK